MLSFSDDSAERPLDRVQRKFHATHSNRRWVAAFADVAVWIGVVVFVIDVFAMGNAFMCQCEIRRSLDSNKGWGLGLAICRRLIDAIGGNITVESEKNRGSVFVVHLPQSRMVNAVRTPLDKVAEAKIVSKG